MARYVDWKDVTMKYIKAATGPASGSEELKISYIEGAEAEVDAALSGRYTTPFTPCPPLIKDIVIDLTYWKTIMFQKDSKTLKDYIDQRLNGLAVGSTSLVMSGTILTNQLNSYITNYQLDRGDPQCGTPVECSRKGF